MSKILDEWEFGAGEWIGTKRGPGEQKKVAQSSFSRLSGKGGFAGVGRASGPGLIRLKGDRARVRPL